MSDDINGATPKVNVEAFVADYLASPKESRAGLIQEIASHCTPAELGQIRRAITAPSAKTKPLATPPSPQPLSSPAAGVLPPLDPVLAPLWQDRVEVASPNKAGAAALFATGPKALPGKPLPPFEQARVERLAKAKAAQVEALMAVPSSAPEADEKPSVAELLAMTNKAKAPAVEPAPQEPEEPEGGGEQTKIKPPPGADAKASPDDDEPSPNEPKPAWAIRVDVEDPYQVAFEFLASRYTLGKVPLLRFWRGSFLRWTGTHYAEMDDDELLAELWDFLSKINGGKLKPQQQDVNQLRAAIKARVQLKAEIDVGAWLDDKSDAPWGEAEVIVCKNRVVRLSDGAVWPHNPRLFVTNAIDTEYLPAASAPRFTQFLDELWADDDATRNALQEFFGLVLTDETRFQKGFIIVGPARSGKGTIARTLRNLLGAKNYCGPNLAQLSKDFGLEPFIGKKIAVIPDARTNARTNRTAITERLLSVIGEDPQDTNRKNAKFWQGILRTRVMILSNELPDFKDDSGVIATRFIILQMHRSFLGSEDHDLEKKLIPELSGILNWAVAGWQRLAERKKFLAPGDGALNDELAGIGSSIRAFVADRCDLGPGHQVARETLYSAYREWCFANGLHYADRLQSNLFSGKLRAAFPGMIEDTRPRVNNPGRKWLYVGLRLHGVAQPITREELLARTVK
jgi:putative DNA primase/helicase